LSHTASPATSASSLIRKDEWTVLLHALITLAQLEKQYYSYVITVCVYVHTYRMSFVHRRRFTLQRSVHPLRTQLHTLHAEMNVITQQLIDIGTVVADGLGYYCCCLDHVAVVADEHVTHASLIAYIARQLQAFIMARIELIDMYTETVCNLSVKQVIVNKH
jgi:hypothetical protein